MYAKKYRCVLCDKLFDHHGNFQRHEKTCKNVTKFRYPGGYFKESKTIFEDWKITVYSYRPSSANSPGSRSTISKVYYKR